MTHRKIQAASKEENTKLTFFLIETYLYQDILVFEIVSDELPSIPFNVDDSGKMTVNESLDRETTAEYFVKVSCMISIAFSDQIVPNGLFVLNSSY